MEDVFQIFILHLQFFTSRTSPLLGSHLGLHGHQIESYLATDCGEGVPKSKTIIVGHVELRLRQMIVSYCRIVLPHPQIHLGETRGQAALFQTIINHVLECLGDGGGHHPLGIVPYLSAWSVGMVKRWMTSSRTVTGRSLARKFSEERLWAALYSRT